MRISFFWGKGWEDGSSLPRKMRMGYVSPSLVFSGVVCASWRADIVQAWDTTPLWLCICCVSVALLGMFRLLIGVTLWVGWENLSPTKITLGCCLLLCPWILKISEKNTFKEHTRQYQCLPCWIVWFVVVRASDLRASAQKAFKPCTRRRDWIRLRAFL